MKISFSIDLLSEADLSMIMYNPGMVDESRLMIR